MSVLGVTLLVVGGVLVVVVVLVLVVALSNLPLPSMGMFARVGIEAFR